MTVSLAILHINMINNKCHLNQHYTLKEKKHRQGFYNNETLVVSSVINASPSSNVI